jgi:hypothetical protein
MKSTKMAMKTRKEEEKQAKIHMEYKFKKKLFWKWNVNIIFGDSIGHSSKKGSINSFELNWKNLRTFILWTILPQTIFRRHLGRNVQRISEEEISEEEISEEEISEEEMSREEMSEEYRCKVF